MDIPEFPSVDTVRRLWWLHDSFWHAALVKELGFERANRINAEVAEKIGRMIMNQLLREKVIKRPRSIQDVMSIFKVFWKNTFFDGLYVNDPITFDGNTATWYGSKCYVYEAVKKADMLDHYECGCKPLRDGAMKALRLKPLHEIKESLVRGDGRCVIEITFAPEK